MSILEERIEQMQRELRGILDRQVVVFNTLAQSAWSVSEEIEECCRQRNADYFKRHSHEAFLGMQRVEEKLKCPHCGKVMKEGEE